MRVLLIRPPAADPTQTSLAVPALAACCRSAGIDTDVLDLAVDSFDDMTTSAFLAEALRRIRRRLALGRASDDFVAEARVALAMGRFVGERVESAKADLKRDATFYDFAAYKNALYAVHNAMRIIAAAHFPTVIDVGEYHLRQPHTVAAVRRHVVDTDSNVYLDYVRARTLPRLRAAGADLIGISVTYRSQLLPTLTLLHQLATQSWAPPVLLGGAFLTTLGRRLAAMHDLLPGVGGVVMFEGESALLEVVARTAAGRGWEGIPNLVTIEDLAGGQWVESPTHVEDFASLPPPDFTGLPFDKYLTPEPVLPLQSVRGCYWGKCSFCAVSRATSGRFRSRSSAEMISDMDALGHRHGCRHYYICDDATPPRTLAGLAQTIRDQGLPWRWSTEVRFERLLSPEFCRTLAEGGCVHLLFGFESSVQRVLDAMHKGTDTDTVRTILKSCRDANICVNLQAFLGFPGETVVEAERTVGFFADNRDLFTSLALGSFSAVVGSGVVRDPARFGVGLSNEQEGDDAMLETWVGYRTADGLSPEQARELADRLLARLIGGDLSGPGLLYGSSGAHGQLYAERLGRQQVDALSVDIRRWIWDMAGQRFRAARLVTARRLGDDHALLCAPGGITFEASAPVLKAFRLFRRRGLTLPDAAIQALPESVGEEMLAEVMAALVRLTRLCLLEPVGST
ncbi:MAG: radical SAM protein [Magnetococcus sp. DMHC-8]